MHTRSLALCVITNTHLDANSLSAFKTKVLIIITHAHTKQSAAGPGGCSSAGGTRQRAAVIATKVKRCEAARPPGPGGNTLPGEPGDKSPGCTGWRHLSAPISSYTHTNRPKCFMRSRGASARRCFNKVRSTAGGQQLQERSFFHRFTEHGVC